MKSTNFTIAELKYILFLICDEERKRRRYLNKRGKWDKLIGSIKEKIKIMLQRKIERECKNILKKYLMEN